VTSRPDQLTTLQALDLSNGPRLAGLLSQGAANLLKANAKATSRELIGVIYRSALCREPADDELRIGGEILGGTPTLESVADLLWTVLMLPEFQLVR
jgi:hypothetical protein